MIERIFVAVMIILLVILVYEFVHALWTVDVCVSYYQLYGNYNYTIPLTDRKTNTWDCYHQSLNEMILYVSGLVTISIFLGMAIRGS